MSRFHGDHIPSDDMPAILEMFRAGEPATVAGSSTRSPRDQPVYLRKQAIKERVAELDAEIDGYVEEINSLKALAALRGDERTALLKELASASSSVISKSKGKGKATHGGIDYENDEFEWSRGLRAKMKEVFGINTFRLCQQGVCNANMDGRDIVCIMPTGGGKSLTYQLPALLQPGCTLVISPLISLITDQILHLQEAGVQAVKITGGTSKAEARDVNQRLIALAERRLGERENGIKLCYVTPEKIAKSKSFVSLLQKLVGGGQLARIVIDEAHCVSQLGHDFRPDYQKLFTLRQLFPRVPIMALSATCPPKVLEDLIKTLCLRAIDNADTRGTLYFSSPLYRPNLHYTVQPKPAKGSDVMRAMTDYILEHHADDSGIIYCLSKKDAEGVADGLVKLSGGRIKTGVYHADRHDRDKEGLHIAWRRGTIKVVCATIAFGLGIDKGDVRFVLHHSLSKSLEGFYQESGRAGRDGKDSDCVLYYRPQDGTTLSSMVSSEKEGQEKLYAMLSFAQNIEECRKAQFAKYFSHSAQLSMSAWSTGGGTDVLARCGHCDNCTRSPDHVHRRDVTLQAWQLLRIAAAVHRNGGNLTLNMLAGLARGAGGGVYEVTQGKGERNGRGRGRGGAREKMELHLDEVAGGVVNLTKDEIEHLLVQLLIQKFLQEKYHQTAYSTCVYIVPGPLAPRLTRHTQEALKDVRGLQIECLFRRKVAKARVTGKRAVVGLGGDGAKADKAKAKRGTDRRAGKRKRDYSSTEEDEGDDVMVIPDNEGGDEDSALPYRREWVGSYDSSEDEDIVDDWLHTLRSDIPIPKKRRSEATHNSSRNRFATRVVTEGDIEVLVLSDY